MKNIYLLGATGSIGTQTLDIIRHNPEQFNLISVSFRNMEKGLAILNEFKPRYVSVDSKEDQEKIKGLFPKLEVGFGLESLIQAATYDANNQEANIVVTAVVGSVGLVPTIEAIKKGYDIALANKETLVTAGHIVTKLAQEHRVTLFPVDSEHSAIYQSLNGEHHKEINKIIITASGGSFRHKTREELKHVTVEDALKHPNWAMGAKITIDSATMANKGLEVIEAHWLFDLPYERIETILHQESVIHSMVEFVDTSVMAQLGTPDMRLPIQYALTYPNRYPIANSKPLSLADIATLHFKKMDFERYPMLQYAYESGKQGGSYPTVLNAANEAAVELFLKGQISFLDIEKLVYNELKEHKLNLSPDLETVLSIDQEIKAKILKQL
jgi:1-deoxy-D-xylulose-5-phosphate reductoisomerase